MIALVFTFMICLSSLYLTYTVGADLDSETKLLIMTLASLLIFKSVVIANLLESISTKDIKHISRNRAFALISWTLTLLLGAWSIGSILRYPVILESLKSTQSTKYAQAQKNANGYLSLSGEIGKTSTESLSTLLNQGEARVLVLNSTGGLIDEANKIAKLVKTHKLGVVVTRECFSACVLIAVSSHRLIATKDAEFGFHRASIMGDYQSHITRYWSKVATEDMFRDLKKGGIPEQVLAEANKTPNNKMHYINAFDLKRLGMNIQLLD